MRRRVCKPFSKAALERGARIEHREHPEFSKATARKIARDHLCEKGNRAYPAGRHFSNVTDEEVRWLQREMDRRGPVAAMKYPFGAFGEKLASVRPAGSRPPVGKRARYYWGATLWEDGVLRAGYKHYSTKGEAIRRLRAEGYKIVPEVPEGKWKFNDFVEGRKVPRDFGGLTR